MIPTVGKMAMIYRRPTCCGTLQDDFGVPFIVESIETTPTLLYCDHCHAAVPIGTKVVIGENAEHVESMKYVLGIDNGDEVIADKKELEHIG